MFGPCALPSCPVSAKTLNPLSDCTAKVDDTLFVTN